MPIHDKQSNIMKNLFQKFVLTSGVSLASILVLSSPGNASVFYDLEFFSENGELVGTGEFSHEDDPLDETINLCRIEIICGNIPLEIPKEDNFFRVDSFFSTVQELSVFSRIAAPDPNASISNGDLFWRPFDEEKVASTRTCPFSQCFQVLQYSPSSWSIDGRVFTATMTTTEWNVSGVIGRGSGTWTATRRTTIPEPASTLGLIAISAMSVGLKLKHKSH